MSNAKKARPCCPQCGDDSHIYARLDLQWDETAQAWGLPEFPGDHPLECTECDAEFYLSESDFPDIPDYVEAAPDGERLANEGGQA